MLGEAQKSERTIKEKNALVFIYDNYRCEIFSGIFS